VSISTAEDFGDPAHGDRVPRCAICGVPESSGNRLIPGWWGYLRFGMELTLCEREVLRYLPREMTDPIQLEETG
jgi:hypothetical protein